MKKKLMMVAVLLGALTLGACVDDNESQSVTDVRNAKAEQLKSIAAMNNAEAQAKVIYANAEAELKKAEAALKQAQADKEAALAKIEELKAKLESDAYNANLAAELAKAEKDKALAEAQMAKIKGNAEKYQLDLQKRIAELQVALLQAQVTLTGVKDDVAEAEMARLEKLAKNYGVLLYSYTEEQNNLANLKTRKLKMETNLTNWKADKEVKIAENNVAIKLIDDQIAYYKEYSNYTSDLTSLQNKKTLKKAEIGTATDKQNALQREYTAKQTELGNDKNLTDKKTAIEENDLIIFFKNSYDADYIYNSIYFGNYCPIVTFSELWNDATIEKEGYNPFNIKSLKLEVEAKDLRVLKLDVDKAITDLDIKGLTDAINTAETGTKAVLDQKKKSTVEAEAAYKKDPTKEQEYRDAVNAEKAAQTSYDNSVKALEAAQDNKAKLEACYKLVSTNTADLVKAVDEYNAAVREAYTPLADMSFALQDATKGIADLNSELAAIDAVLSGDQEVEMNLADWLLQQYGSWFTGNAKLEYETWVPGDENNPGYWVKNWQQIYLSLWNMSIKLNAGSVTGAEMIETLISGLETAKADLEKDNANYSHVTKKEQAIALKDAEIKNLEGVISVIEIQMAKAKAALDAAVKAATPAN